MLQQKPAEGKEHSDFALEETDFCADYLDLFTEVNDNIHVDP